MALLRKQTPNPEVDTAKNCRVDLIRQLKALPYRTIIDPQEGKLVVRNVEIHLDGKKADVEFVDGKLIIDARQSRTLRKS